jgi:hypothetical protein
MKLRQRKIDLAALSCIPFITAVRRWILEFFFLHGHKELNVSHFTEGSNSNAEPILNPDRLSFFCPPILFYRALRRNK